MKFNKFFMVLAATAFVACSSDDLNVAAPEQAAEDSRLVELNPNFVLAGVGVEDTGTRTHWEQDAVSGALVNKFLPIWATAPAGTGLVSDDADLTAQAVGLCWLGQTPNEKVYTNYQFYHYGWLNKDEKEANVECDVLMNGWLYEDVDVAMGDAAGDEADPANFSANAAALAAKGGALPFNINYNSGVYKTDNKAIFGGDYIVYYPFNDEFKEAGTIPAKAETTFTWNVGLYKPVNTAPGAPDAWTAPELGDNTFRYSAPVHIDGGDQAADFGMYNLSTLVRLRVSAAAGDPLAGAGKIIDQVVLYSPSKKLLKQANLAADKIVAGKTGAELYAESEGVKTITTNFVTTALTPALDVKATTEVSAYITVLPTAVPDLKALVHNATDGTWATVEMGSTEFKAGKAKVLDITVATADFKADYIAVDEASLTTALTEARAAVAADLTGTLRPTIAVIGDIEIKADALTSDGFTVTALGTYNINNGSDAVITITGDDIIVPEDVTLNVNTIMASKVRVLGKSCCDGANGGILDIQGGTVNNVTMEPTKAKVTAATYDTYNPTVTYSGAATIAAGKTFDVKAGNVVVNTPVEHKGDLVIAEGAKLTVDGTGTNTGDLNFMGSKVTNSGTIEVLKGGKFDMTAADGSATATDGKRMTNNATGKFIHNVDAGVGTAVQSMVQNGEYRCRVDDQIKLDDAYLQWTACNVIEMVNASAVSYDLGNASKINPTAYKHNGKFIDIEVNSGAATTFTKAGAKDNLDINIGKLTVTAGGLRVNFVSYTPTGGPTYQRSLTVNGDVTAKANLALQASKKITVTENLTVENAATLQYKGTKLNAGGLAVTKDITVSGATFNAYDDDALNITCANFYLKKVGATGATAKFGNRTEGDTHNLDVTGTISNPAGCTFDIRPATGGNVLAWVTCSKLEVGGAWNAARPKVVAPE